MDNVESDGCIDWLHLAPIDHERPLCALESPSINVSATTPAVTSNKEKETDDCSIDCLNPVLVDQSHHAAESSFDVADTSTSDEILEVRDQAVVSSLTATTDIGEYKAEDIKNLTNENKRWLLMHSFRPASKYKFPSKIEYGKARSFQHAWLQEFPWLSYSESLNCINCILFSKNKCLASQLVMNPMTNLTRAKQTLQVHASQQSHLTSMKDTNAFLEMIENTHLSVQQHLETQAALKVKHNRDVLRSMLKIIIFCGK